MLRQETWSFTNPPVRRDHVSMKILTHISRFLLGFIFLVFGLNGFLHFIPMPPPSGVAGPFLCGVFALQFVLGLSRLPRILGAVFFVKSSLPPAPPSLRPTGLKILFFSVLMN